MTGFSALPASSSNSGGTWSGVAKIKGPKWAQMPLVTVGMLGLQIVWSVEMGYASPYLLSLGLSKSLMSIVFIAGPLSGLIVQPLIGVLADHSRSRFGRRRPFMIVGSLVCVGAIILLGFTRVFSGIFTTVGTRANDLLTIAFAIWSIYCIDFSINAVQAADRALLVDLLPPSKQETGNAWAGRMFGLGSVAGFFVGNVDLPKALPFLGKTQLEVLSVVTSIFFMGTQGLTSASVSEKVLVREASGQSRGSLLNIFRDIWNNIMTLPRVIFQICLVQFFAWIAWFPVLFFSTVYLGEIYVKEQISKNPSLSPDDPTLQADATRAGSRALLWSSVLSLVSSIILPAIVMHSSDEKPTAWANRGRKQDAFVKFKVFLVGSKMHVATLWTFSHLLFAVTMGLTFFTTTVDGASAIITLTGFSWAVTQWVPFSLLGEAILSGSPSSKYSPAEEEPIPLSDHRTAPERQVLMFDADQDIDDIEARRPDHSRNNSNSSTPTKHGANVSGINIHLQTPDLRRSLSSGSAQHQQHRPTGSLDEEDSVLVKREEGAGSESGDEEEDDFLPKEGEGDDGISNKAGIILGIHNIFVVIPQFLVTGFSSILFALLEPDKSILDQGHAGHPAAGNVPTGNVTDVTPDAAVDLSSREAEPGAAGTDSIGLIFRIGGVSALVACVLCWRLSRELLAKNR